MTLAARTTPPMSDPFVGRSQEQQILREAWERASGGRGQLVLIEGEPGVGKTRLARELSLGLEVGDVWSHCQVFGGAPAFWAFRELLRGLSERLPPDRPPCPFEEMDSASEPLAPSERFKLFHAVDHLLHEVALEGPLLWVVDDVHAANLASLELLTFVAQRLTDRPVLIVATCRSVARGTEEQAERRLVDLARWAQKLPLGGLHADAVTALFAARTGTRLVPSQAANLVAATGGNPLFLDGVSRAAQMDGVADVVLSGAWRVPPDVGATIAQRLEQAGADVALVLEAGSVLGQSWRPQTVAAIVGLELEQTLDAIDRAELEGLVVADGRAGVETSFAHQLIQETVYRGLARRERRRLHRRAAEVLERLESASSAMLLDHHLAAGDPEGRAEELARQAGLFERRLLAYEAGATHFRRALELSRDPAQRAGLLLELGDCERLAGDPTGARTHFLEAARLADRLDDSALFGEAAIAVSRTITWGILDIEARSLLERAHRRLKEHDRRLEVRVAAHLAEELWVQPESEQRRAELSARALELAREEGDRELLALALNARMKAIWGAAHVAERTRLTEELSKIAASSAKLPLQFDASRWRMNSLWERGHLERGYRELETFCQLAEQLKSPHARTEAGIRRVMAAELAGRLDDVEALVPELLETAAAADHPHLNDLGDLALLSIRKERGGPAVLAEHTHRYRELAERLRAIPAGRCLGVYALWAAGQVESARSALRAILRGPYPAIYGEAAGLCMQAEVAAALEEPPEVCRELYTRMSPFAEINAVAGLGVNFGSVERYLGLLAARLGELHAARGHLERAVHANASFGTSGWGAYALRDLAVVLRRAGDASAAASRAAEARHEAQRLGFTALAAELERWDSEVSSESAPIAAGVARPRPTAHLNRDGTGWRVSGEAGSFHVGKLRGLTYIAQLLGSPEVAFSPLQLAGEGQQQAASAALATETGFDVLDEQARRAYQERLAELREADADAKALGNFARAAAAREEREFIEDELLRATGLGGRTRQGPRASEKARVSVTNAIRRAVAAVAKNDEALGRSLRDVIQTGSLCQYVPERSPIGWVVGDAD